VQSGDTLSSIASRFGTTIDRLVEINGLESADVIINVGQKLLVPTEPETP
jgi:LysM repeat protein